MKLKHIFGVILTTSPIKRRLLCPVIFVAGMATLTNILFTHASKCLGVRDVHGEMSYSQLFKVARVCSLVLSLNADH